METNQYTVAKLAPHKVVMKFNEAITALREALAQPEQKPMHPELRKMWEDYFDKCFRTQPEQEPVAWRFKDPKDGHWLYTTHIVDLSKKYWRLKNEVFEPLYTTPPAAQPEPPPEWEAINNIIAEYGLDAIAFVAEWKAAQRPWQGLTDEEVQFYIKKHSKLVNAGYDKMTDTNLVAKTFDNTGFYKEVSAALKERNHD
jgi:hypothetical protein